MQKYGSRLGLLGKIVFIWAGITLFRRG
jgi:hypothetical protein